jgi:hypothetical protein
MAATDIPHQAPNVISRMLDGEAVLVHLGQNKIRVLNPLGARLWELADGRHSVNEIAQTIATEYQVELARAETDALAFYADLAGRGVLTLSNR